MAELSPEARQRATFASVRAVVAELVARGHGGRPRRPALG